MSLYHYLRDRFQTFLRRSAPDKTSWPIWIIAALCIFILSLAFYIVILKAPANFPAEETIHIERGMGLAEIASYLETKNIIRSPVSFRILIHLLGGKAGVQAGDYFFDKPLSAVTIAIRMTRGISGLTPIRVVLPEGTTVAHMSLILGSAIPNFNKAAFVTMVKGREGYLFPDTYDFLPNATAADVAAALSSNFQKKINSIDVQIKSFGKPVSDIITMASILEEEGRTTETRRTIAGILWKRLAAGYPLQVDAPFEYTIGKNTFQLTDADLKTDSPYNTYIRKGLPPTPITNPGLDSILAAVTPIKTPYLFYLSDIRGVMHYAKTYEEHLANKAKYLQ